MLKVLSVLRWHWNNTLHLFHPACLLEMQQTLVIIKTKPDDIQMTEQQAHVAEEMLLTK